MTDSLPKALVETAAVVARERIRDDRERARAQLEPVLAYLGEHLLDHGLRAEHAWRRAPSSHHKLCHAFKRLTGRKLPEYVRDRRLDVARWLLRHSRASCSDIGEAVYIAVAGEPQARFPPVVGGAGA